MIALLSNGRDDMKDKGDEDFEDLLVKLIENAGPYDVKAVAVFEEFLEQYAPEKLSSIKSDKRPR